MPVNIELCKHVLSQKKSYPVLPSVPLCWDDLVQIARLKPSHAGITRLISPAGRSNPFTISFQCFVCGNQHTGRIHRDLLISTIKGLLIKERISLACPDCIQRYKHQKEEDRKRMASEYESNRLEDRETARSELSSTFLNPEWAPDNWRFQNAIMKRLCGQAGDGWVKEVISAIPYRSFLKTAYWKCCAFNAKRSADFKCFMCSESINLDTHHRTYEFHGLEHTSLGQKSLICLCRKCHSRHHDKIVTPEA